MMDVDSPAPRTQPPELGIGIIGGLLVGIGPIPLARLLDEGRAASLMAACFRLAGDGHRRDRAESGQNRRHTVRDLVLSSCGHRLLGR